MAVPGEIQSRYVERRKQDLENCLHSLELGNFFELEKIGHQLKGNGMTFGFEELSTLGRKMEQAAISRDVEALKKVLDLFSFWINRHIN